MVKVAVLVTDKNWFEFLRNEKDIKEVNFWNPSGSGFTNLVRGELVLFKLKAPVNMIAGGGIFTSFEKLPWKLAWDTFRRGNGAESAEKFHNLLLPFLTNNNSGFIGCTILSNPFFFPDDCFLDQPTDWSSSIVRGKYYDTSKQLGLKLWDDVQPFLWPETETNHDRFGKPQLILPRIGQGGFRSLIRTNYNYRCAVTKERTLPVLEAAHIKPYSQGGSHDPSNGILFRSDIHKLFDEGYVTVTPEFKFEVSQSIREEFQNGREYYALHGRDIFVPSDIKQTPPDLHLLEWHNENCFKDNRQ